MGGTDLTYHCWYTPMMWAQFGALVLPGDDYLALRFRVVDLPALDYFRFFVF